MRIIYLRYTLLLLLVGYFTVGSAQDNTLFFLRSLPQKSNINASVIPEGKAFIGFPALSSVHYDYYNSAFALKDVLHLGTGARADSLVIDMNGFANSLSPNNVLFNEFSNTWLTFGFKVKSSFFTFALSTKYKSKFFYPASIGDIPKGNYDYSSGQVQTLSTTGTNFNTIAYNELALGYAKVINEKVTVGGRIKFLQGLGDVHTERVDIDVATTSNSEMTITSDILIKTSLPLEVELDSMGYVESVSSNSDMEISRFFDNRGFGIDLGATYKPIPKLVLGIALNDIGYIRWSAYPNTFTSNATFKYSGVDLSDMFIDGNNSSKYFDQMKDSIKSSFIVTNTASNYTTGLQGNIVLSGNYQMLKWLDLGALVKSQFYYGQAYPSLGLACAMSPSKLFSSTVSYSMRKGSYNNLGVGFAFNPGALQFYLAVDNISNAFALENAKAINMKFGINFILGSNPDKKDKKKGSESKPNKDVAPTKDVAPPVALK